MSNQGDLFGEEEPQGITVNSVSSQSRTPLAERVRPTRLEQFVGQDHLVGPGGALRLALEKDTVPSFVLWGPPGSGKTTLARIVAWHTDSHFMALSAVNAGIKEIRETVEKARMERDLRGKRSILFIDEIHRFNKTQQDALLPHVEDGTVTFVGATTENPSFSMNAALLSRCVVYALNPHSIDEIQLIIIRALEGKVLSEEWIKSVAQAGDGDARRALGVLERLLDLFRASATSSATQPFDALFLEKAVGHHSLRYDRSGEEHYNTISAFIKSMRDSDPDAALYYLARMIEAGEDPLFIARRIVIFSSEDIGNADPRALPLAMAARDAVAAIGMPEARINLAQAVTFMASAPKSNASYLGIDEALADVRRTGTLEVPKHIRNAPTQLMKDNGYGIGYRYAHDEESRSGFMTNLPNDLAERHYYRPVNAGLESNILERLTLTRAQRKAKRQSKT